jgi:tRNA 2-thiouridine synthesizing protein D
VSLTYAIVVNGPAYGTQAARSAYQFSCAVIELGHTLTRVFFYQDGVLNSNALTVPASDEFDLVAAWQQLAQTHQVELHTCVAAALRRGIIGEQEAQQHQLLSNNLASDFEAAGLGSLAEVLLSADRVIQF